MQGEKHRIVIDTNLFISFLLTGNFTRLDQLLKSGQSTILISRELLDELVEVAERPKFRKYFQTADLTDFLINLQQVSHFIQVISKVDLCRDGKDNFLLSLAIDGNATHLLTGDKDLLVLNPVGSIQILEISEYLSGR